MYFCYKLEQDLKMASNSSIFDNYSVDVYENYTHCNESANRRLDFIAISKIIGFYGRVIILCVGIPGNILSLAVFFRLLYHRAHHSSLHVSFLVYFATIAIADTFIILYLLIFFLERTFPDSLKNLKLNFLNTQIGCPLAFYLENINQFISAWSLASLSINRLISVLFPSRAKVLCTPKRSIYIVLSFTGISYIYNCYFFWTRKLIDGACLVPVDLAHTSFIIVWIQLALYSTIPSFVMIICNVGIICGLHKRRVNTTSAFSENVANTLQVTPLLISTSLWFALTSLTYTALNIYKYDQAQITKQENILLNNLNALFLLANHAGNFYLYVLTGCRFRTELKVIFKELFKRRPLFKCLPGRCIRKNAQIHDNDRHGSLDKIAARKSSSRTLSTSVSTLTTMASLDPLPHTSVSTVTTMASLDPLPHTSPDDIPSIVVNHFPDGTVAHYEDITCQI